VKTILDGDNNLTTYTYDGFNRLSQTAFPVATQGADASSTTDLESLAYDAASNVLTDTKRDGSVLSFTYDALNRVTQKAPSVGGTTVNYAYDLLNRQTSALYASSGQGVAYGFDALSRITSETTSGLALSYQHDLGNNTTQITWPDGFYATYAYDNLNRMTMIQDSSGGLTGAYITYAYDNTGRRTAIARGNSTSTSSSYDGLNRLTNLAQSLSGTGSVTFFQTWSALSQITSLGASNTAYISHPPNTATGYTTNGRNQYTTVGSASFTYDAKGNLTSDGTRTFTYDIENRLLGETGGPQNLTITYDPTGRLNETVGSATTQFLYAGSRLVAEYNGSGTVLRRYVPGVNADEPALWYEGAAYTDRRWLHADAKGSIIAYTDGTGTTGSTYGYGPYGEPNAWAGSRFRYTGQIEIPEAELYYHKARVYDPGLGRFLQTDPAGYDSDVNPYSYASCDPVNGSDPSGLNDSGCNASGSDCTIFANFRPGISGAGRGAGSGGGGKVATLAPASPDFDSVMSGIATAPCSSGNGTANNNNNNNGQLDPNPGRTTQVGGGVGFGGFAVVVGGSLAVTGGISVPNNLDFRGVQLFANGEADGVLGLGVMAFGKDPQGSVGSQSGALPTGVSSSTGGHGEIGASLVEGAVVGVTKDDSGTSISVSAATGAGVEFAPVGVAQTVTFATPTVGQVLDFISGGKSSGGGSCGPK
jgi:RHS repeat-associated protein